MSSKKKRLAKGLGAGALAVATIVSGLSFGAASASAMTSSAGEGEVLGTTKLTSGSLGLVSYKSSPGGSWYDKWQSFTSPAGAQGSATTYEVLSSDTPSAFQLRSTVTGNCLGFDYINQVTKVPILREDGCFVGNNRTAFRYENGSLYAPNPNGQDPFAALTTSNDSLQAANGTVITAAVGRLGKAGNTSWDNLSPVIIGWDDLTAQGSFDTDISQKATVSGTAEPDATVTLKNGATTLGTTTAAEDGTYSFDVDAPNKGGALALTVTQTIDGKDGGSKDVELDYGKAVAITGPEDQEEVAAGSTAITGSGEAGSDVQVFDNSGRNPVISAKVRSNGTWSGTATLTAGEHTLEAKQMSKGANTTTATVTVNPGQSALTAAEITTDEYTPGQRTTFAGTATAGATVDILDGNGSVIVGGVRVAEDGSFSFQHTPAANSTEFSFRVRQTLGDATRTDGPFTIDATVDAFAPVTVSRPATVTAGVENVFSGTATPNATYRVLNASGSQIVPGTFTIDADGNWTFRRAVSTGASKFDFKLEQTLNGETRTSQLFSIRANAGYTVTNTTRSVRPGVNNTFTGTGPAGASYRVLNMSGTQIVPGTFDIDGQGNWTFDRVVSLGAPNFKFKLEVTTADGATFTSPLYTVNAASLTPVTVDTIEVFPGRQNTFEGTGEPGATYSVLNMSDTVLDPSIESTFRVGQDGKWEFKRVVSMGAANFKFKIRQTLNGQTTTSDLFTIDAATFQAPTVDNEYVNAGIWNTFTGTVTPGATIRVLNTSNNELSGVTDLVVGADGKYSFKRIVGATSTKLDFRIEQTHLGKTMIGDTVTLQARTADVTIDNTTVTPGRVNTFTGTATPGATFQVFTVGNVGDAPLASGTVSAQGRFAFDRTVGAGATSYAFKIVLTKDGKQSVSAPFTITASTR